MKQLCIGIENIQPAKLKGSTRHISPDPRWKHVKNTKCYNTENLAHEQTKTDIDVNMSRKVLEAYTCNYQRRTPPPPPPPPTKFSITLFFINSVDKPLIPPGI